MTYPPTKLKWTLWIFQNQKEWILYRLLHYINVNSIFSRCYKSSNQWKVRLFGQSEQYMWLTHPQRSWYGPSDFTKLERVKFIDVYHINIINIYFELLYKLLNQFKLSYLNNWSNKCDLLSYKDHNMNLSIFQN